MGSLFLSHSHADKPFARKLAADLRAQGHAVWIDEAEINIGDSLIEKIREGLDAVDYIVAILSGNSINSAWVQRELDIASNREIKERRVVVLPVLVEKVEMPGFLEGKKYGDFCDESKYDSSLQELLKAVRPVEGAIADAQEEEVESLRAQLKEALQLASQHERELERSRKIMLRGKSAPLQEAIERANRNFPRHRAINETYAFEAGGTPVTLDYLLWAANKSAHRGGHVLEALLTINEKWPEAHAMLEAASEMAEATTMR